MLRSETISGGFFLACWAAALAYAAGGLESPGLPLSLYGLFAFAATLGWVVGNLFVVRLRARPIESRRGRARLMVLYLFLPVGLPALLFAMAPVEFRAAAPLAGLLALGVQTVFFFVPVSLRPRS